MKCTECKSVITDSSVSGDIEYHVCGSCGEVVEMKVSAYGSSYEEAFVKYEKEHSLTLPTSYKAFLATYDPESIEYKTIKVVGSIPDELKYYIGKGEVTVGDFLGVRIKDGGYILDSVYLAKEWETPEGLVLISGDGHTWLALDYRSVEVNPPVVFIAGDDWVSVEIAANFEEVLKVWA